jgi:hypothetical protein
MPAVAVVPSTKVPAVRTKERQALASALAAHIDLQAHLQEALLGQEKAQEGAMSARRELEEARSRPDDQRAVSADQLIACAATGVGPPAVPTGPSERDKHIAVLENIYQQWRLAAAASEKAIPGRRAAVEAASERVRAAAMAVAAQEASPDALMARAAVMQKTLISDRIVLRFVAGHLPTEQRAKVARFLNDREIPGDPYAGEAVDWSRHPVHAAWRSAVDALCRDVDAPLPDVRDG